MSYPILTFQRLLFGLEVVFLFILLPFVVYLYPSRIHIQLAIGIAALYVLFMLRRNPDFSWHRLWHGTGWSRSSRKKAFWRYCLMLPPILLLTYYLKPNHFLQFPLQRPLFWLLLMLLYPLLSVLPQELIFRPFFFERYKKYLNNGTLLVLLSALSFSLVHIVFHNFVSPILCLIGGYFFAKSYQEHRSLKWAVLEHAAYGCTVFTVGLGSYFFLGSLSP